MTTTWIPIVALALGAHGCAGDKQAPAGGGSAPPPVAPLAASATAGSAKALEAKPLEAEPPPADAQLPLEYWGKVPDQVLDAAYAAVVAVSGGRCHGKVREVLNSSVKASRWGDDVYLSAACGNEDTDKWTVAVVGFDGTTATVLGAKHVDTGQVATDTELTASETEVCLKYNTIEGYVTIKGFPLCAPLKGGSTRPAPVGPRVKRPAKVLPAKAETDEVLAAAGAALIDDTYGCDNATNRMPQHYVAANDGDVLTIAATCGDIDTRSVSVGLIQQRGGRLVVLEYSTSGETDSVEPHRIRADDAMLCVDYTRQPLNRENSFCVFRER